MPAIFRSSASMNAGPSAPLGATNKFGAPLANARRRRLKITSSPFSASSTTSSLCSPSIVIIFTVALGVLVYVFFVVSLLVPSSSSSSAAAGGSSNSLPDAHLHEQIYPRGGAAPPRQTVDGQNSIRSNNKKDPNYVPHVYNRAEWGDQVLLTPKQPKPGKDGVIRPELFMQNGAKLVQPSETFEKNHLPVLTAYLEPINRKTWKTKPLPMRTSTAIDLKAIPFPKLQSCSRLPEQWPVDDYPDEDPFLPWIHDVFPTHDGTHIQFIAQNKRRCRTGTTTQDIQLLEQMEPQPALFQHVAVQRIRNETSLHGLGRKDDASISAAPRYRLSDHEHADADGMETRFICRFQPSGIETLSVYNFDYDWASFRKRYSKVFQKDGRDNKQIHTSQLTFLCPVPPSLVETVRTGSSIRNDYATIFVDLVPIRTPPRYGVPAAFFPPYYSEFQAKGEDAFDAKVEWGEHHILPKIEDSGRWANIPICKPSLLTYGKQTEDSQAMAAHGNAGSARTNSTQQEVVPPVKQHHLASCLWASSGYSTRGNRFAVNDGQRRLLEWITYHKLIGVDHFYLYDNSGAFSGDPSNSLHPIAELFPEDITVIDWPSQVCNNNPNNVDSVGERSSQYAAEASCRLRFGPHVQWIAQFDIDEYLVPMGNSTSILPLLEQLDREGNKIVSFGSWRAWPRHRFIETPIPKPDQKSCFDLKIPMNYTMLQAYNCDRQKPGEKEKQMPAEKQIYRPDYVLHHFIHYSTVTKMSAMNKADVIKSGHRWAPGSAFPDPLSRFGDERTEALMLHSKAVATQDTAFWDKACKAEYEGGATCRLGTPFPDDMTGVNISLGDEGWKFNCYVNHKIDDYWVPLLEQNLKAHIPELASRLVTEAKRT